MTELKIIGFAKWRLVSEEPRHNTWHNALHETAQLMSINLQYIGLQNTIETEWIDQILPDSILKQFPYLNVFHFFHVIRHIKKRNENKTLIYIFEGTIFWLFLFYLIKMIVPNCMAVCNLFSSSKFNKKFFKNERLRTRYKIFFYILNKYKKEDFIITFDTQVMADKARKITNYNFQRFPVPSSFGYRSFSSLNKKSHHKVLVNMRGLDLKNLHIFLRESCQFCEFVFPRGPLSSQPLESEFGSYKNALFNESNIPISEYQSYIDSFDYMIFLYMPVFESINASGRILDAITRGIPVCVPMQLDESAETAKIWGRYNLFDYTSVESMRSTFNHPIFSEPIDRREPPFTPRGALNDLVRLFDDKKVSKVNLKVKFNSLKIIFVSSILMLHTLISIFLNIFYQVLVKLTEFLKPGYDKLLIR